MKKRVLSMALALVLTLGLAAPVFAEAEDAAPAKRLVHVDGYKDGEISAQYVLNYEEEILRSVVTTDGRELTPDAKSSIEESTERFLQDYKYGGSGGRFSTGAIGEVLDVRIYDEEGKLLRSKNEETDRIWKWSYDEDGNLEGSSTQWYENEENQAVYYEYYYENGVLCDILKFVRSGETEMMTDCLCGYDEQTGLLSTFYEMNSEGGDPIPGGLMPGEAIAQNYEYDDEGRLTGTVVTKHLVSGTERKSATGYTYEDHDGGTITYQYAPGLVIASYATEQPHCEVYLGDDTDFVIQPELGIKAFEFDTAGEVALTCDDEGYLTRLDAGDGVYYEFTYEPVA